MESKPTVTYALRTFCYGGRCTVVQKMNGHDVNEYDGYDCKTYFALYPKRRITASPVPLERHNVDVFKVRRDY